MGVLRFPSFCKHILTNIFGLSNIIIQYNHIIFTTKMGGRRPPIPFVLEYFDFVELNALLVEFKAQGLGRDGRFEQEGH